jgi:hypothetical protein
VGYFLTWSDIFKDVPNTFLFFHQLVSPMTLRNCYIIKLGIRLLSLRQKGYSPGTLQPLYFHFDMYYFFLKIKNNEEVI